jgi:hypothetical protein
VSRVVLFGRLHVHQPRLYRRIPLEGCSSIRQGVWKVWGQNTPHRIFILRNSSLRVWGTSIPFFFGCLNQNDLLFSRSTSNNHVKVNSCVSSLGGMTTKTRTWDLDDSGIRILVRVNGEGGIRTRPETNPEMAVKRCFPSTHSRTLA